MTQPTTRRQFFKQVAVACAGIGAAVVVAPAVLTKEEPEKYGVGNRVKHIVIANGIDCKALGHWENYYKNLPSLDHAMIRKYEAALRSYKFNYPFGKTSMKTKKQRLNDIYEVYKTVKVGERPERKAKDGSVTTHPVMSVKAGRSEAKVLAECLKWLKARRVFCDRHDCGSGHGYAIYGIKGAGDVIGILPDGRHFEIECKRGGGGRLSDAQRWRMADVRAAGGEYWVVHGLAELVYYMGDLV